MKYSLFVRPSLSLTAALVLSGLSLQATTLAFSGSVRGNAIEDPYGRCAAPFITVDATGSGTSNLLGNFTDSQSHCTTSLTTFGDGIFTLTSQSKFGDSLFGIYAGTASVGVGGVLDFSAVLTINGGSGDFAGASGLLDSGGVLTNAGVFAASFSGNVSPAPEPATLWIVPLLAILIVWTRRSRRVAHE